MKGHQSWVTYAGDDREGLKALVLARSLRRSITTRPVTVFVSNLVSDEIWELLESEFDRCIRIHKRQLEQTPGLCFSDLAKINCWKLTKLKKFVFLDCNCLVTKNSDELFKHDGLNKLEGDGFEISVLVGTTSNEIFKELAESSKACLNQKTWMDILGFNYNTDKWQIAGKYNVAINLQANNIDINIHEISVLQFKSGHPIDILTRKDASDIFQIHGSFEKAVLDMWLELFFVEDLHQEVMEKLQINTVALKQLKVAQPCPPKSFQHLEALADSIAIVGMGLRFPGSNNIDEFWDLLINGRDGIIKVPDDRWTEDQCFNRPENTKETHAGFLKCPIDQIDAKFFGLSPMEVSYMDPQQRLTLQVMWEALEHSGINAASLKNSKTGVFGGWWRNDYKEMLQESGLNEQEFFRTYMGNALGTLTSRISHVLELTGPSISTESGCSTSIVAVDMACKSLLNEDCDLGLAFGVNLLLHPFSIHTMNSVIAMDGHCKTFDAKADGFGRAEGCAVLILKRFSDAVRDGDKIWSLIRGSAVVQEGPSRSLGTPTVQCEALAMKLALEEAGVEPREVSFVETHGTGTPVGDPLEVAAVAEVYSKGRKNNLIIGSVKTNIGHTESCSGIAGIIKTVLSIQNEVIPPHRNFETLNPDVKLEAVPAEIPMSSYAWPKNHNGQPRIAGVSSFGITGTDAHVIIQETPDLPPPALSIPPVLTSQNFVIKVSGKSQEALDELLILYKEMLINDMNEDILRDFSYTANVGRGDFQHRSAIIGQNKSEICGKFQRNLIERNQIPTETPRICFLFTGQGSQYPGMAKDLYEQSPVFKMNFDICNNILERDYGINIIEAMWGNKIEDLSRTIYSQTSIFCVEYCLLQLWKSWEVKPDCVLGHSLGEFAAAVAAEILTFEDAIKLVAERSRLIDSLPRGKMLVLKESQESVESYLKQAFNGTIKWLDFAAINSAEQTVLAGSEENVMEFAEFCKNNKIKTHILDATHPFHSRLMEPMLNEYRQVASTIKYKKPNCTYFSGMEGQIIENSVDAEYWVRHTREPVRFTNASKAVLETECTLFLELGPQPVLSALMMINADTIPITCVPSLRRNADEWSTILGSLGKLYVNGMDINWENFHRFSESKNKVSLPFYPFQNKSYWFDVKGDRQRPIHPLVGTPVPNPSQLKLFQNQLSLYNLPYLMDHTIGNTIIMPGAGFLEMCLVAGHASFQCLEGGYMPPISPVTLEDFVIEGPLALSQTEKTQMQVLVSSEEAGETRITIYSKLALDKETHKWIRHASALFSPYAVQGQKEEFYKNDSLENIKTRCNQKELTTNTYDKFLEFGLKFGPVFRTLTLNVWKTDGEIYFEASTQEDTDGNILHPVIIDAMLQAIVIASDPNATQLKVPISISKFIWYSHLKTKSKYIIHVRREEEGSHIEYVAVLYDANGERIAMMLGATFLETSVGAVLSVIEAQRTSLPSMFEEVWRSQSGPLDKRIPQMPSYDDIFCDQMLRSLKARSVVDLAGQLYYNSVNKLCINYMIKAFYELNWNLKVGQNTNCKDLLTSLKIQTKFHSFVRYMLNELANEGFLQILHWEQNIMEIKVVRNFPSQEQVLQEIDTLYLETKARNNLEVQSVSATGNILGEIMSGRQSALTILFPEDSKEAGHAENYYYKADICTNTTLISNELFKSIMKDVKVHLNEHKKVYRILEVGAGTGVFTQAFLPHLDSSPSGYEYTYTDISPVFFSKGEKVFENSHFKVIYKTLDLEQDPMSQGYIPHYYDMICASFVIHATKDVRKSVANLRNLLRPGGSLLINELVKPFRAINLVFGVLEGFWAFKDFDLRPHNCEMSAEKWETVLKEHDFARTISFDTYLNHASTIFAKASDSSEYISRYQPIELKKTWLLFSDGEVTSKYFSKNLSAMGKNVILIKSSKQGLQRNGICRIRPDEPSDMKALFDEVLPKSANELEGVIYLWGMEHAEKDYDFTCRPFLSLCKTLLAFDHTKVFVFTRGVLSIGDHEMALPSSSPLIGMTRALQNENPSLSCRCVDLEPRCSESDALLEGLSELFMDDSEITVAYRGNQRHVCRLIPYKILNTSLSFPKSDRTRLILPSSNAIPDLRFGVAEKPVLNKNEVEVFIKAYSLNFRDIFTILKPDVQFENLNTVGLDYAGIITAVGPNVELHKVGDQVLGINLQGDALPSHIKTKEDNVISIPDNMTFCEAATLPAVVATTYMCLMKVAKLKKGETILIHTGSGGVGLCAIQYAKSLNCNIITTAGSTRKRTYLRNLGIKHIFNSRNTDYQDQIKEILGGAEVDVVLNSLTGPGFKEASLAVCKSGARFIEMSKLNIWTKEEVKALRPDVFYEAVDVSSSSEAEIKECIHKVDEVIKASSIKPIPYVRFDACDIREALSYMQKAKHIGKIVCVMPEMGSRSSGSSLDLKFPMFNDKSTYLITGGLGGIGIEVCKWMAESGAKHILLVGRNLPDEKATQEIKRLNLAGVHVVATQCDVGNFDQCRTLLKSLKLMNLPTLRGIMHSAGVLSDGLFENQTWEKYQEAFNAKVKGGWNLHLLTLDYPLEHFVMFSSAAGLMGSLGQSNHSAANVFLDALTNFRNSIGLPATSVNWGQWGQVGVAANLDVIGLKPMTPLQGTSALEKVMKTQMTRLCVLEANFYVIRKAFPGTKKYLAEFKDQQGDKVEGFQATSEDFWKEYDAAEDVDKKCEIVKCYLRLVIKKVLKLDENEPIDDNANLQDIGMDSLMMIEMKNILQALIGDRAKITVNSVKDCHTVAQLATRVVELVSGVEELAPPTREELNELIREDAKLPAHIQPQGEACKLSEIRTVLITGATGNLGPYILKEISRRTHITKVYCLMRGNKNASPRDRLLKKIRDTNLSSEIQFEAIECVGGNVTQDKFGLSDDRYKNLSFEVDAVFHLAVKSTWQDIYRKGPASDGDVRTVNVQGMKNILEFACSNKSKHLFHAGAILSVSKLDENKRISESWPESSDFDTFPNDAYPISKFICDLLISQAVERGLPCKVFRFPFIGGDSKTGGNISALNNALMLRMMAYMHLGIMPAYCIPFVIIPVDTCAEISSRIFFNDEAGYEVYNISNPHVNDEQELEDIAEEFGHKVETVEPDEFVERLSKLEETELLMFVKKGASNKETRKNLEENIPEAVLAWITNREADVFLSDKLERLVPDYPHCLETSLNILRRDLQFAKSSGLFAKLGMAMK